MALLFFASWGFLFSFCFIQFFAPRFIALLFVLCCFFLCCFVPCYELVFRYCLMIFNFFLLLCCLLQIPNLLAVSRAPSTLKGYHAHFRKWKAWAARFPEVIFFPALELHVALYLISLIQSGYSFTTISLGYYSISFFP